MKNIIFTLLLLLTCGCVTRNEVYATKPWEGHFYTTNDFIQAASTIHLEKGESVWVLSNKTLLKVLENSRKGK